MKLIGEITCEVEKESHIIFWFHSYHWFVPKDNATYITTFDDLYIDGDENIFVSAVSMN